MAVLSARNVFRPYEVDGVPDSGPHSPKKSEIIQLLESMQQGTAGMGDYQGVWDNATEYVAKDYVEYGGNIWYAKRDNVNVTPVEGADWTLLLPGATVADGSITPVKLSTDTLALIKTSGTPGFINILDWGAVGDGDALDLAAFIDALEDGRPIYVPPCEAFYNMAGGKLSMREGQVLRGAGKRLVELRFDGTDGIAVDVGTSVEQRYIEVSGMKLANRYYPSSDNETGIFAGGVTYSRFFDLNIEYFGFSGIHMSRRNGAPCWFNTIDDVMIKSAQRGIYLENNGQTVNNIWMRDLHIWDVGAWTGGRGVMMEGYGHTIDNIYAGLPGARAAVETGTATGNCHIRGIYSESSIEYAIFEGASGSTARGPRKNVWEALHVDLEVTAGLGKVFDGTSGQSVFIGFEPTP